MPSSEVSAVRLASQFYRSHAPHELIKIWRQKLRRRSKWDASFMNGVVDAMVDRTRRDLRRSSNGVIGQINPPLKRPAYQFPYNAVTLANIEHVIDRGFLGNYVDHAKPLTRFLEDVLKKDSSKNKGKGKRLNEDEDQNGNEHYNVPRYRDDEKDVAEDEESEVEEDVEEAKEDAENEEDAKDVEMMDIVDAIESQKVVRMTQTIEAVGDVEVEDAVKVEDKIKGKNSVPARRKTYRNPISVRGCIAAMLLFMTSQKCNAFQTVMGVFLHCTGCPTRVLDVLSSLGLSVSDDQVRKALANMTTDAMDQVRKAVLENDWFIVYDNINIAMKHQHQRVNKLDTFENRTAATVILIHAEGECRKAEHDEMARQNEKNEHGETSEHDERSPDGKTNSDGESEDGENEDRENEDTESGMDDENDTYDESDTDGEASVDNEGRNMKHGGVDDGDKVNKRYPSRPPIVVFRPDRLATPGASIFFPNATDRTLFRSVCRHHFSSVIAQSPACVMPLVEVDLLPIRKTIAFPLQTMKIDESTIVGNLSVLETVVDVGLGLARTWFAKLPVIIVAGDQMTVARLLSLLIHRAIDPDPFGSLSWVHPVPQLFHLRMTLCGTIFRTHYGDTNTRGSLGGLIAQFRRKNLAKDNVNFKAADELLKIVFEALLLLLVDFLKPHIDVSNELDISQVTDSINDTLASLGPLMKSPSPMILGRPCTTADINALLLLRDVAVYIELGDAIKLGDIGRIRSILPTITLMMHGGGNTNYARELLRLLYGMRHTWTVEWERRVLSSMLVNPKGVAGGWMATDMYQETNNYLLKAIFAAKGPNMSWEYLRDYVSTNIRAFQEIARMFERAVGAKFHNPTHVRSTAADDVNKFKKAFEGSGILTWDPSDDKRPLPDLVVDLQREGGGKMAGGALEKFLASKIDHHGAAELEETEASVLTEHVD
ncbi:hypothetical protein EC991_009576 [Linnemannia zychae]|nr:hypothetical protein EC991_009576 [Linnemannia zychae]